MTITRLISFALAITFLLAVPGMAMAGGGKGDKPYKGIVSAVDLKANTITITRKKSNESTTFQATAAKVTVDGAPAKLSYITVGMHASVTPGATADTAAAIDASTHKKGEGKHAPATPFTPSAPSAPATSGTTAPTTGT
jgi:hypothetical protein